jgi:hypothetical protein
MMNIQKDQMLQALSAELDGELSPEELRTLEQALGDQKELRNQAANWAETGRLLGDTTDIPVPPAGEMLGRLRAAIDAETPRPGRILAFPIPWAAAAAAFFLLLGAGLWFRTGDDSRMNWPDLAAWDESEPVMWVETHVPDSSAVVYEDEETGVTVIWMVTDTEEVQGG